MSITLYHVDAFTTTPFKGNPAAICLLERPIPDQIMQAIAAELNLSETAFVTPQDGSDLKRSSIYSIRWFTPMVEVSLCAHATLATSAVIFAELQPQANFITYQSLSGQLVARRSTTGITLDFPADTWQRTVAPSGMLEALGLSACIDTFYGQRTGKLVFRIDQPDQIPCLKPDFAAMLRIGFDLPIKGVAVTARVNEQYDFISRFFNPWSGVNEDPVTGSVHTVLAPYWGELLGKQELLAYQASPRGGELRIKLVEEGRMKISGQAVMIGKGHLLI